MHKLSLGKQIFATVNPDLCTQSLKYNTVISILMQYKNNFIIAFIWVSSKNENFTKWC
jgi:hypothetical protein